MMVVEPQEAGEHIKAGNMRVIATVAEQRLAGFPNVPTIREAGYDVPIVPQVRGIVMPPGVSPDVVAYYEDLFGRMTKTASWKNYLKEQQFEDGYMKAAELTKFFDVFSNQMRGILKEAGIKVVR